MLRTTSRKAAVAGLAALTVTSSLGVLAAQAATLPTSVTITGLSVAKGSSAATTSTLISGTGFLTLADPGVKFGANKAANFIVLSDTQIAAVAPKLADDAEVKPVDVTLSDGEVAYDAPTGSTKEDFTYLKPYNATVADGTLLSSMGGTRLTVKSSEDMGACGSAFTANKVTATVGGLAAPVSCLTPTTVQLTVPAGTQSKTGPKVVLLHDGVPGAPSTTAKYAAVVGTLDKPVGSFAGGETVTLTGKGFKGAKDWKFGTEAASCSPAAGTLEDTKITCIVPAPAGASATPSTAVPGAVSISFTAADEAPYGVTSKATYTYSDLG